MSDPKKGSDERFLRALGQEIAYWRKHRGLTRVQLAERVGVSESTIKRAELKGPQAQGDTWRIAEVLDVDIILMIRRAKEVGLGDGKIAADPDEEADRRLA